MGLENLTDNLADALGISSESLNAYADKLRCQTPVTELEVSLENSNSFDESAIVRATTTEQPQTALQLYRSGQVAAPWVQQFEEMIIRMAAHRRARLLAIRRFFVGFALLLIVAVMGAAFTARYMFKRWENVENQRIQLEKQNLVLKYEARSRHKRIEEKVNKMMALKKLELPRLLASRSEESE